LKNLVLSSLLLLLLSGCSASLVNRLQRLPESHSTVNELIPWFQGDHNPILYKTTIDIYQHHFSGLMVIKQFPEKSHRVLFITEMGIKIFDMEFFSQGDIELHYCLEALNRRSVIRTLKNDIGLMIRNVPEPDKKVKVFADRESKKKIIRQKTGLVACYYFIREDHHNVDAIIQTTGTGKKVNLCFYSAAENLIDSVKVSHYKIQLDIHLTALHENKTDASE